MGAKNPNILLFHSAPVVRKVLREIAGRAEYVVREDGRSTGIVFREDGELRTVRGRFVVGADGIGSVVARKLGLQRASKREPPPKRGASG